MSPERKRSAPVQEKSLEQSRDTLKGLLETVREHVAAVETASGQGVEACAEALRSRQDIKPSEWDKIVRTEKRNNPELWELANQVRAAIDRYRFIT